MGDVLAGINSSWEFDTDSVLVRFERGIRTPKLFHVLGERRVPYEALRSVELAPGTRKGTVVLRAEPRPGADPLMDVAAGQLRETSDPYRLVLPTEYEPLAASWVSEVASVLGPASAEPAERHLVAAPAAPLQFKAYDGKVSFDGETVSFRWFWTGASSAKWKAGDQTFAVGELEDVEWRSPEVVGGHLRLVRHGERDRPPGGSQEPPPEPDQDPAAVVFGLGYGLVHESLPLAASVLEAVRAAGASPCRDADVATPVPHARDLSTSVRPAPADIADRIRHLGELHDAGLLTDDEFSVKKAELLAEL
ncbi:DUF4429 domain-containing protein [Streptomyces sp. TRM43335]|uniref:DUF4429 domain-containing protein n=1 Tax=Streptomyces taklimakanensis TaxID=2569853 RepID=A0A6G2B9T0_9ACTN|nr:DUF4429 domain-containing protein [Streptomyces taklimakanensis]MTE18886.1 DUF4429 domain-containing protein [Streptomyces taklimakanensis]